MEKRIGVLDFGYFNPDYNNSIELLNFTFDFIKHLENQNFSRYWMAEHYNDFCSWTNPEILLTVLAGMTDHIKIGSAGILTYFHSPYRVSTAFKMLATLFPHRIDLGIARGDVHPHMVKHLLGTDKIPERVFKENESNLINYLTNHKLYDSEDRMIPLPPYGGGTPGIWTLGTSLNSASNSIKLDTNFSLSLFHEKKIISEYLDIWLQYIEEKVNNDKKELLGNIAIEYTACSDLKTLKALTAESKITYNNPNSLKIIGEPSYCEDKLNKYFDLFGVNEIIVHDISRGLDQRMETIDSLSKFTLNSVL